VLITDYILKYSDMEIGAMEEPKEAVYTLADFAKALEFTLISEGFNLNKNMHDDAQILRVRLNMILNSPVGSFFTGNEYVSVSKFITNLVSSDNQKAQIININLENLDDIYSKAIVKIY